MRPWVHVHTMCRNIMRCSVRYADLTATWSKTGAQQQPGAHVWQSWGTQREVMSVPLSHYHVRPLI